MSNQSKRGDGLSLARIYLSQLTRKGSKCNFFQKRVFWKSDSPGHTDYSNEKISKKACLEVKLRSFEVGKFTHKSNAALLLLCVFRQVTLCKKVGFRQTTTKKAEARRFHNLCTAAPQSAFP